MITFRKLVECIKDKNKDEVYKKFTELLEDKKHLEEIINKTTSDTNLNLLHLVCKYEHEKIAEYLIENYPNLLDMQTKGKRYPIHFAFRSLNIKIVKIILNKKPEYLDKENGCGQTPLVESILCNKDDKKLKEFLRELPEVGWFRTNKVQLNILKNDDCVKYYSLYKDSYCSYAKKVISKKKSDLIREIDNLIQFVLFNLTKESKSYNLSVNNRENKLKDIKCLAFAVSTLLGCNIKNYFDDTNRQIYLGHLNHLKGKITALAKFENEDEVNNASTITDEKKVKVELEGFDIDKYLAMHIFILFSKIINDITNNILENTNLLIDELVNEVQCFYLNKFIEIIYTGKNNFEDNQKKEFVEAVYERIKNCEEDEEYTIAAGHSGHAIYVNFIHLKDDYIEIRIDNAGQYSEEHKNTIKGSKVLPVVFGKININKKNAITDYLKAVFICIPSKIDAYIDSIKKLKTKMPNKVNIDEIDEIKEYLKSKDFKQFAIINKLESKIEKLENLIKIKQHDWEEIYKTIQQFIPKEIIYNKLNFFKIDEKLDNNDNKNHISAAIMEQTVGNCVFSSHRPGLKVRLKNGSDTISAYTDLKTYEGHCVGSHSAIVVMLISNNEFNWCKKYIAFRDSDKNKFYGTDKAKENQKVEEVFSRIKSSSKCNEISKLLEYLINKLSTTDSDLLNKKSIDECLASDETINRNPYHVVKEFFNLINEIFINNNLLQYFTISQDNTEIKVAILKYFKETLITLNKKLVQQIRSTVNNINIENQEKNTFITASASLNEQESNQGSMLQSSKLEHIVKTIENGDLNELNKRLTLDITIADKDNEGNTLLHIAAKNNQKAIALWLLEKGYSEKVYNNKNQRPRDIALEKGYSDLAKELITQYQKLKFMFLFKPFEEKINEQEDKIVILKQELQKLTPK